MDVRWFLVVALCVLAGAGRPAAAATVSSAPDSSRVVSPVEWADLALARCHAEVERSRLDDQVLAERLAAGAPSRERATFLTREEVARTTARRSALRGALARLGTLMFGVDPKIAVGGSRPLRIRLVLEGLFGGGAACAVEAVEATIVLGLFGLPFTEAMAVDATPERQFRSVKAHIGGQLASGVSLEQIFVTMRAPSEAEFVAYLDAVTEAATAFGRGQAAPDPLDAARRRAFVEYVPFAVEPIRIQFLLHGKVDALEGAFGVALPDGVDAALLAMAQSRLYDSMDRLRRLREREPEAGLAELRPILDEWLQRTALPALGRALMRDPHAAYWFFVQSGGVVEAGAASAHSRVVVRAPMFVLGDFRGLSLDEVTARVERLRIPAAFQSAFAEVDAAFTNLTLSRVELGQRLDARQVPPALAARLRALMANESKQELTSLDLFTLLIRDAHLVRGRLDRKVVRTGLDLFFDAKSEHIESVVGRLLESAPAPDPRLGAYLRTAAAMMLELEQRQATDAAFRQQTGGGAAGWVRGRLFAGSSVPVRLQAKAGVTGQAFAELVDVLTPKNGESGADYRGRAVEGLELVYDGREYYEALVEVINSSRYFLNISAFDWKTDTGGRDIAYRLMAKKLGIDGADYARFLATFAAGLPLTPAQPSVVGFYDIPSTRMKQLIVWHAFMTSAHPDVVRARAAASAAGASLACETVATCGDLTALVALAEPEAEAGARSEAGARAGLALEHIAALFAEGAVPPGGTPTKTSLAEYCDSPASLRRFVRRVGLRRADRPDEPFPINIVADAKQNMFNISWGERSDQFPFVLTEPVRDIYFLLLEFDVRVVLWKGLVEFPWHAGPVPWPGRKVLGRVPFPFIPWPWISAVPGFGWANTGASLALQWLFASDLRIWWASVSHTKSWSHESMALESGMGMGSKYFNEYDTHKTWHDMGVIARGPVVDDVNDHFLAVFNEARVNNAGLPASRGVPVPRLDYTDYRPAAPTAAVAGPYRAWLVTTHPERGDANYRGIYLAALAAARHSVHLENSFFSDPLIAQMLIRKAREFRARVNCENLGNHECAARRREAVRIHIVLPDSTDKPIVDAVGAADFHEMLHLGIKVHRWNPKRGWSASRMLHSKVWVIDYEPGRGGLTYVGAANATQRSHLADNEAGIVSNDPAFAAQVYDEIFVPDITEASRLESVENLYIARNSNLAVRASRWLRRFLVGILWLV